MDTRSLDYSWRVRVRVPAYERDYGLRIEVAMPLGFGKVFVEGWTDGPLKHTFGGTSLCLWFHDDPPDRKWSGDRDPLIKLVDLAVAHLFKEMYFIEHGEWPGDEAPHGPPKQVDVAPRIDQREVIRDGR